MKFSHTPVLLKEVIAGLAVVPGQWYVDATLGGGGYTTEILKAEGRVLGIDADCDAIDTVRTRLKAECTTKQEGTDWILVHDNFRNIQTIIHSNNISPKGIVFDLGVSSYQLDTPEKGFSFRFKDAPLDMRLDQSKGEGAQHILQTYSEEELYEIFAKYGEEERSRSIAHAIVRARKLKKIEMAWELREILAAKVPGAILDETSARIFQALRIVVNDELQALKDALDQSIEILTGGGRVVVVSFHSLEDRIVKQKLKSTGLKPIAKEPIRASQEERDINYRSRSAKLRIAEKL